MNFDHWRFTVRGVLMEWLRRPEQAIAAYADAFRANPHDVQAARSIAWIHAQQKRWLESLIWQEKALALVPEHADTWFNLAYAQEQSGQREAALASFQRVTALKPEHDRAWYGIGMMYAHQGDHAAAAAALQTAADLQPMNDPTWYALGMAHHHNADPDGVKRVVEHCVLHSPVTARRLIQEAGRADLMHLLPAD